MGNSVTKMTTASVCWATGPALQLHELAALQRQRQDDGEIEIVGPISAVPRQPGMVRQPYVLRRARARWLRRKRNAVMIVSAIGVYALSVLVLAWELRYVLGALLGAVLTAYSVAWLVSRFGGHKGMCVGIHCAGCPDA